MGEQRGTAPRTPIPGPDRRSSADPRTHHRTWYEFVGAPHAPIILALGGISATRHVVSHERDLAPGWWEGLGGAGRPLDLTRRRVLGVDFLDGGCAADGQPNCVVTTRHQAERIVELLDDLGIARLDAVIGASYGGMVALALAEGWPERVGRLVVISAAHEPTPMATALRVSQRRIVEVGLATGRAAECMAIARGVAMTTYRTSREFDERFDSAPTVGDRGAEFPVERYLRHAGERFAERMEPARFLALSLSADLHAVRPEHVTPRTTLISAQGDTLVPPSQMRALARRLPALDELVALRTRFGHDAFLTEPARLARLLTTALADCT
ncbi:MAG TPA: homoserine O-succinyltransferase [Gemmatimonadaceae bacterium]|nr:homoserine O-succinyltransferase [Gemmatimonadaceae bacterium]